MVYLLIGNYEFPCFLDWLLAIMEQKFITYVETDFKSDIAMRFDVVKIKGK